MTAATESLKPEARTGRLYLVPAPLDFGCADLTPLPDVLPQATIAVAARLTDWICENAKSARAYLKRVDAVVPLALPLQAQQITELPRDAHKKGDHAGSPGALFDARPLLTAALNGRDVGLLSEAGMPAVADPGSSVVRAAHDLGLEVVALTGPVSLLLALAASGLNGQNFSFVGYLPQDASERARRIRELETLAMRPQLLTKTPSRIRAFPQAVLNLLQHNPRLSVSSGLTLPTAQTRSRLVKAWRQQPDGPDNSTPAVFAIGR